MVTKTSPVHVAKLLDVISSEHWCPVVDPGRRDGTVIVVNPGDLEFAGSVEVRLGFTALGWLLDHVQPDLKTSLLLAGAFSSLLGVFASCRGVRHIVAVEGVRPSPLGLDHLAELNGCRSPFVGKVPVDLVCGAFDWVCLQPALGRSSSDCVMSVLERLVPGGYGCIVGVGFETLSTSGFKHSEALTECSRFRLKKDVHAGNADAIVFRKSKEKKHKTA